MEREQLQSWNIMSFNPKNTDVDEHIDLINTLGDMVDQKDEAKMEKFIETMPTMIPTHLIICKDWAVAKDKAKSLKHIIRKCDPSTPAVPLLTTGATVLGLYSHIAHLVDKDEEEIPPPFKGAKLKQTRARVKPKGKPQGHRQNPPKDQEADEAYTYDNPNSYYHNDNYTAPGQNQGRRPFNGQSGSRQFRSFTQRSRGQRPQYNQCQFQNYRFQRCTYQGSRNQYSSHHKPFSREINQIPTEVEAMAGVLNKQEDAVMVGPITRVITIITCISITLTISRQNSMAHPVAYAVVSIIPLSTATKEEHNINNIMEKMSINPHKQQQGTLYQ